MRKEIIKYLYMYKRELLLMKKENVESKKEVKVLRLVREP